MSEKVRVPWQPNNDGAQKVVERLQAENERLRQERNKYKREAEHLYIVASEKKTRSEPIAARLEDPPPDREQFYLDVARGLRAENERLRQEIETRTTQRDAAYGLLRKSRNHCACVRAEPCSLCAAIDALLSPTEQSDG